ncbi:Nuclear transport factor 2 (NTF2) family protein with RNA binding (RRM-RBD-RNP motif) domain [Forsythia ovata]|uniref:Nuclear transport factor 2 (NTF2) family protein with RNA binding (RRM-RBD-RNP motif) domain n=1 Tax=Forsythia ovata TaxID=205694 RepID=A0ABD1PHW9_9LAMI
MATSFPLPVTAAQVGTYFVGQYYQLLQNQPDFVHQFYSDASTMLRIDSNTRETATAMLQIHQLIMSLNYMGIEIKTAHSLESWNGGVLVMVSGSVHVKDFNGRRKFVQTFFLAPQEKGYFVLNDIFHYVEEEQIVQHPLGYLPQSNLDPKLNPAVRDQVPNYMLGGDIQPREFMATAKIEENGPVNSYTYPEEQLHQVPETEKILEDNFAVQSNGSLQGTVNSVPDRLASPIEEPVVEPQKHTYASILQVAKGQSAPAVPSHSSFNKPIPPSEWQHVPEPSTQPSAASSNPVERSGMDTVDEASAVEDEVEVKSVYVRSVPTTMAASEIADEFKKFGKLKPDGVAIRTRKDIDVCYAFVEFEDISGVQNAVKASMVQIGGHQLHIEGRRPSRINLTRGGRGRGRGRVSYQMEGIRGRLSGRGFSKGINQDGNDHDYNRPRGNGFYRQAPRQERSFSGNHQESRNGQYSSE